MSIALIKYRKGVGMNINVVLSRLKLWKEAKDDKLISLSFRIYKGNLRAYVVEYQKEDMKNNTMLFSFPITTFSSRLVLDILKKAKESKEEVNYAIDLFGAKWDENNQRVPNEREFIVKFGAGKVKDKDDNLVNVIYIVNGAGVKYVFPLQPTPYVTIYKDNKEVTDPTVVSDIWFSAYIATLEDILAIFPEASDTNKTTYKAPSLSNTDKAPSIDIDDILNEL